MAGRLELTFRTPVGPNQDAAVALSTSSVTSSLINEILKRMFWRELWDGDTVLVRLRQCFSQEVTDTLARMVWSSRYGSTLVDVSSTCLQVIFSRYSLNTPSSRQIAQACLHLSSVGVRGAWVTLTAGSDGFFFYPGHTILSRHASSLTSLPTIGNSRCNPSGRVRAPALPNLRLPPWLSEAAATPHPLSPRSAPRRCEELCPDRRQDILSSMKSGRERTRAAEAYKFILLHQREVILRAHAGN